MSWLGAALNYSSTRSNNPNFTTEAREERRQKIEKERLEKVSSNEFVTRPGRDP